MEKHISGKIKIITETKTFGANGFRKRETVITTDEQYPQSILIEFIQDKCELLDKYKVGEDVKISYNLRGKEWVNPEGVTKYFNAIQGWRIESLSTEFLVTPQFDSNINGGEADDLPF